MLQSRTTDDGRVIAVFRLDQTDDVETASVVGDFNDWSDSADPMTRDEGGFLREIVLSPGKAYRFRYLIDGGRWENDWAAHAYVPNEFGGDDSVIDLTDAGPAPPASAEDD